MSIVESYAHRWLIQEFADNFDALWKTDKQDGSVPPLLQPGAAELQDS